MGFNMRRTIVIPMFLFMFSSAAALPARAEATPVAEAMEISFALSAAMESNPEIAAARAQWASERSAVFSKYWPESPTLEFMRENNTDLLTQEMGPMNWWGVSQEILFPLKYIYSGSAQESASEAARERSRQRIYEIREEVLSAYYEIHSLGRILSLLEAQRETLREVARIAESRRATGEVSQQDEMKAHLEQTKIETEILLMQQELTSAKSEFNALLNRNPSDPVILKAKELPVPTLELNADQAEATASSSSTKIAEMQFMSEQTRAERSIARLSYLPDFMLSYRKPYTAAPDGAYTFTVGFTVPLWFFAKQSSENAMAGAKLIQAEKELESAIRQTTAKARSLHARAKASGDILEIYKTSLIPQATSAMNSSRAAYQSGRAGFVDLLDSERSLYEIRIGYYRTLSAHVKNILALETAVGKQASTLPFPDNTLSDGNK
ncbi:MAG: hypothetical protein A2X94_08530 [Bdellovibrionales bacterium GWB1_55_8]|nr:MAG: hypothetical protein A2X94_08530 [Bdellovibrionales bacterium GWB1_55_8]